MPGYTDPQFDTLALHAGSQPDPATGARAVPIHLTTSFVFDSTDQAASLFNLESAGHVYSRISNPTNAVFEQRIAALEGGIGAIATASGQAALHLSVATLMGAGSHIVASSALYGGSHNLLHYTLKRFGIDTTFVPPQDTDAWRAAIRPNTRLLFGETVGNPGLDVLNVPVIAQLAHDHALPLLVDATLSTPYLMQPLSLGADLVYHSATKFLGGHGVAIRYAMAASPLGRVLVAATSKGVCAVKLGDQDATLLDELRREYPLAVLQHDPKTLAPWTRRIVHAVREGIGVGDIPDRKRHV